MKKAVALLCAGVLLALSGCAGMLERSFVSSTAHVDYSVTEDSSILRAESYQGLVNSILYFINAHQGSGTIRLYNYTGDVEADLTAACDEVQHDDPLGAFAVRNLRYESTRILTYYEVQIYIAYARSADEVDAIRSVRGLSELRQELSRLTADHQSGAALRTSYFTGDAQLVSDLFWLSYYSDPGSALSRPELTVAFYPQEGNQRILEIRVDWPVSGAQLALYSRQLATAAMELMEAAPPAGEGYTVAELARMLLDVLHYDPTGAGDALSALTGESANDLGILLAMEQLCLQAGLEASVAADDSGAQLWLIVSTPSGYRHLLPRDLRPDPERGEDWQLPLYTDEELAGLGFQWPTALHPACVDYSGGALE